jgi:hypothetical protein
VYIHLFYLAAHLWSTHSFMDADDRMHPDRLAAVSCGLAASGAEALLHGYVLATADNARHDPAAAWAVADLTSSVPSEASPSRSLRYACSGAPLVLGEALFDAYHVLGEASPAAAALEEDGLGGARLVPLHKKSADAPWVFNPAHGHISVRQHGVGASVGAGVGVDSVAGDTSRTSSREEGGALSEAARAQWRAGTGANGEGEDVLFAGDLLRRGGRANASLAYLPRQLALYLPTFARRCVTLAADGSAQACVLHLYFASISFCCISFSISLALSFFCASLEGILFMNHQCVCIHNNSRLVHLLLYGLHGAC